MHLFGCKYKHKIIIFIDSEDKTRNYVFDYYGLHIHFPNKTVILKL